jgi:multidrug resistance efflux pump
MRDRVAMLRLPTQADSPTGSRVTWLPWTLTLLLAFSTVSLFVRSLTLKPASVPMAVEAPAANAAASSSTKAAGSAVAPGAVALESKGYIIPAHQIQVSPVEVSGRIVELNIEEGKRFKKGQVLAVLDTASYGAEFLEAEANLANSKAKLDELKNGFRPEEIDQAYAELKEAEETLKQVKLRYERNQHIGAAALSADEMEQSQYAYTAQTQKVKRLQKQFELIKLGPRVERIDVGEAEVKQSDARLRRAKWHLDNCTIRAPVDGTILKKTAELGNLASPLSFNTISQSICDMADLSDLEVELEIPERDIGRVILRMPCKVSTDAYPDRFYAGVVDRLMPIALQNKAAIQVRVKLTVPKEEEGVYLKPGMNSRVAFLQPESNFMTEFRPEASK